MDYSAIHKALKQHGLTWAAAASCAGCSAQHMMGVAARRVTSRRIARKIAAIIEKPIIEVFPDKPDYAKDPAEDRQKSIEKAQGRLAASQENNHHA